MVQLCFPPRSPSTSDATEFALLKSLWSCARLAVFIGRRCLAIERLRDALHSGTCCWPTKAFVYETGENVNAPVSWPWVSLHQNPPKSDHLHGAVTWSVWEDRCTERAIEIPYSLQVNNMQIFVCVWTRPNIFTTNMPLDTNECKWHPPSILYSIYILYDLCPTKKNCSVKTEHINCTWYQ